MLILFLASVCTIIVNVKAVPLQWSIEKVDEAGNVGEFTSIAIDPDDNPHISYQDITNHNLKYAWWNGSTWNIETVHASPTQNIGHHTSLALGSDGHRHISYWSLSTGDLFYATTFIDTLSKSVIWAGNSFDVTLQSNSTITDFTFSQPEKRISLNVIVPSSMAGFCNVTIPVELLGGPYVVLVDGSPITPTETSNATHTSQYVMYTQNSQIEVIGTTVIPEFPTIVATTIVLAVVMLPLLFTKRKLILQR